MRERERERESTRTRIVCVTRILAKLLISKTNGLFILTKLKYVYAILFTACMYINRFVGERERDRNSDYSVYVVRLVDL